jgi:RNA polymerase sigma factor (sigma-70 family)
MSDRSAAQLARTIRAASRHVARPMASGDFLIAFSRDRDPAAFEGLVRRYGPLVQAACRAVLPDPADADDAFQATFVLLHRKADTVRDGRTLGGWLFRVARRTALGLKTAGTRRRDCETRAARPEPVGGSDVSWREACAVLHEELDNLPPRYRLPLILCYLEGRTRDEAATELGSTPDSLRGRLDRGRARLRQRLEKRGITLSAVLLAAVAADAVSPRLVSTTIASARTAGPISVLPHVASIWKGGLTAGLAAAVVLGLAFRRDDAHGQPAPEESKVAAALPKAIEPVPAKTVTVSGVVVGTSGSGVCSVKVIIRRQDQTNEEGVTARTDPGGRFQAVIPEVAADTQMVAVSEGNEVFAAGWHAWTGPAHKELRLREARDDTPIQGRILDLEGKPVAGVILTVQAVHAFRDGGPQDFVDWLAGKRARPVQNTLHGAPPGVTAKIVTGMDGKFRLTGIGRDRMVQLHVAGPNLAHEFIDVATVAAITDPVGPRPTRVNPPTFDHAVAPARLIRGTARDIDSSKPVPGLKVNGYGGASTTTTDKDGRYELPGNKKGPRYSVYARAADGSVYFPSMAEAADIAGLAPLEMDLKVKAGIPVRGRLKDAATGNPVVGTVRYWALVDNPNVASVPVGARAGEYYTLDVQTKPDGTFTCAVLPGMGCLSVAVNGWYQAARVIQTWKAEDGRMMASPPDQIAIAVGGNAQSSLSQDAYQAIRFLNVDAAKPPEEQVIELTPAEPVRGRFIDQVSKPLEGVTVRGLSQSGDSWSDPLAAEFTARPPHPDRPRRLTFRHDERKLVGTAVVASGSVQPVEFKLEPWAALTGRLVDADGKPVARASIFAPGRGRDDKTYGTVPMRTIYTDANGRFKIDGLLPGMMYNLNFREFGPTGRSGQVTKDLDLKAGEERNLGDLKVPAREP